MEKRAGGDEHVKGRREVEGFGSSQELGVTREGAEPSALLGWYWLAGLHAGHMGCANKSLPNALSPPFPLTDVHYGEGGGHPVQPARVQHHRLHLCP